jgi:beta-glucanase (GH16 family)
MLVRPRLLVALICAVALGALLVVVLRGDETPDQPFSAEACEAIDYAAPDQGTQTFAEEFDGDRLDPTRWRIRDDTYLDFDQALIRRENVSVHDGLLDIAGRKLPQSEWVTTEKSRHEWNRVRDYSTGYVDTIKEAGYGNAASDQRFSQKYGTFVVRAQVPSRSTMSRGVWPAFWLRADHELGEIDPMEAYGAPTTRGFDPSASYEWNSWADTSQKSTKAHTQGRAHPDLDNVPIWQGFHEFGVTWSPTCLRYTYDGTTVGMVPLDSKPYFTGPSFDDTFHVRLNMQVGSNYWGKADDQHTRPDFHYLVDWVRVYQGKDAAR